MVVDTGGWLVPSSDDGGEVLAQLVSKQAERAIADADVILLVVDVTVGITEDDAQVARVLQRTNKPVLVVVNKVDDERRESDMWTFAQLGLGDPYPLSAIHGRGSGDLLDGVVDALPPAEAEPETTDDPAIFSVAVVGRPNVGKSTLFNRLVGDNRSVVHDVPGTTRDSIDTIVDTEDGPIRFVDTAGMRRRSRIDEPTEYFSLVRVAGRRPCRCRTARDRCLRRRHAPRPAPRRTGRRRGYRDRDRAQQVGPARRRGRACGEGRGGRPPGLPLVRPRAHGVGRDRADDGPDPPRTPGGGGGVSHPGPTAALNRVIREAQQRHLPPARGRSRHRPRVLYATQGASDPPTFTLFATHEIPPTYLRYLEHRIRDAFELGPTPIKLRVRLRNA